MNSDRLRVFVVGAMLAVVPATIVGQTDDGVTRTHEITIDDYFSLAVMTDCVASPAGKYVAYTELRWNPPEERRNGDIWVVTAADGKAQRLTFDPAYDGNVQWAPDGASLFFTSGRQRPGAEGPPYDGKTQVWRTWVHGGEPTAVTRVDGGIAGFALSRDGKQLYYTTHGEANDGPFQQLREKYAGLEYGRGGRRVSTLHVLDLENWRAAELYAPDRYIREFAVAPDGRRVALITDPDDRLITHEGQSRVEVLNVGAMRDRGWSVASPVGDPQVTVVPDAMFREQAPSPYGWLNDLAWSVDSAALAFLVMFDGYPTEVNLVEFGAGGASPRTWQLERPDPVFVTGELHWTEGRALHFAADVRAQRKIYRCEGVKDGGQGTCTAVSPPKHVVHGLTFAPEGKLVAAILADPKHTPDLYLLKADDMREIAKRLTKINPQVDTWKLPQITRYTWRGANGDEVEGILELPPGYEGSKPLPTIIEIHGGPTASTLHELRFWIYGRTLMAAKGYALLSPNYRGSTGYGDEFLVDLVGRENDIDVADIRAGVDALIEAGIADPTRLGVMGWSNGGFLTNGLITSDSRFRAASSGAGVIDQLMQWALEDTPGHVINYMQGLPWERKEAYYKGSPVWKLDKVTAATLIHVGAEDARVPAAHSRTLFRALHDYQNIPTQLVVYPGEPHGLGTYTHRKAKMEWDHAWFERYLLGKESKSPEPEAEDAIEEAAADGEASATAEKVLAAVSESAWETIPWQPYVAGLPEDLARRGYTVLVDFTADWCATCRANRKTVLERATTRNLLKRMQAIPLRADLTQDHAGLLEEVNRLGRESVPVTYVVPANRPREKILTNTVLSEGHLKMKLMQAGSSRAKW